MQLLIKKTLNSSRFQRNSVSGVQNHDPKAKNPQIPSFRSVLFIPPTSLADPNYDIVQPQQDVKK